MTKQLEAGNIYSGGFGVLSKSVMRDKSLKIGPKALYAYLVTYAGSGTVAWPGRDLICSDLGINKDTFTKYMRELKEKGYIRVDQVKDNDGRYGGNKYTVVTNPSQPDKPNNDTPKPKIEDVEVSDSNNNSINNNNVVDVADDNHAKIKNEIEEATATTVPDSFIKKILGKFSLDQINTALKILRHQLETGVNIRNVGAFIWTSLKEGWSIGQPAKHKRKTPKKKALKAQIVDTGRYEKRTDEEERARKELLRSLYMN